VIGRATPFDRTRCTRRLIGVQRAPRAIGRVQSHVTGRAAPGVRSESSKGPLVRPIDYANYRPSERLTGRAGLASDRTRRCKTLARAPLQLLLLTGRVRLSRDRVRFSVWLEFFRDKHSELSPPFLASGAMENRHFISKKTPAQEINALEGEKTPNPSLPLKLHRLRSNRICMGTWLATS
jgi:hypothetical protein